MSSITDPSLPTLERLGITAFPEAQSLDITAIARTWLSQLNDAIVAGDVDAVLSSLAHDAGWRDMLALTWTMRTFTGHTSIRQALVDRLAHANLHGIQLNNDAPASVLVEPLPGTKWIEAFFTFANAHGTGTGIVRLIPSAAPPPTNGTNKSNRCGLTWLAYTIFFNLEQLTGHPELVCDHRNSLAEHGGTWTNRRHADLEFSPSPNSSEACRKPKVIVVGGGQGGLIIAARLKYLGISTLVVEKTPRVGDNWRKRYQSLCLHDPVWYDHMPYMPFPDTWPVWTPAAKLADWLEAYAHSLELDVWTSSTVTRLAQDPKSKMWTVDIDRGESGKRTFEVPYVVMATGYVGPPNLPTYPGQDQFGGKVLHSTNFGSAEVYEGKKLVVVGAGVSAHDICMDAHNRGIDVTMTQRGSTMVVSSKNLPALLGLYWGGKTPTERADLIGASFPLNHLKLLQKPKTAYLAEQDKELLSNLNRSGFRTNMGVDGTGIVSLAQTRAGGYYLDIGASQLIIDGKIKLKSDSCISSFTSSGLRFKDGSEISADVVVYATGYQDIREYARPLMDKSIFDRLRPVWGLNEEGELNSSWRPSGVEGLYWMLGNLSMARFYSKRLALQILARELGVLDEVYEK